MKSLVKKEFSLAIPPLTYVFLAFALMSFIPGYPILCGAFFTCLGIFQGYLSAREAGDIYFSLMLPVRKKDIVRAKYISVMILEGISLLLMCVFTFIRMTYLSSSPVYLTNVMMAANPLFIAFALMVYALFNTVFLGGYFRTGYNLGKPFVIFAVTAFLLIALGEALHHFPGLGHLNEPGWEGSKDLLWCAAAALAVYLAVSLLSMRSSEKRFALLDL